jgi:predicted ATPase
MLMAYRDATIYEITANGMEKTDLKNTDHYSITKSFLNNPDLFLKHF